MFPLKRSLRRLLPLTVVLTFIGAYLIDFARADDAPVDSGSTAGSNSSSSSGMVLQGSVKHAEQLPSLNEGLQVGKPYSDDLLMSSDTKINNEWFLVPDWYAGVRHCEDAMIVYRYNYKTGESSSPMLKQLNRQDARSGYQRDRNGGIWDYKRVPLIQHVESDFENAVLYVKEINLLSERADRIEIRYLEISIGISKRTGKILSIVQQEQINTVTSPLPGVLRSDVSVKAFDADGKPNRQEQSVIMANITKPFEQIDQYEGRDLRPLFRDFLVSHGLEKLVPEDLEKSSVH